MASALDSSKILKLLYEKYHDRISLLDAFSIYNYDDPDDEIQDDVVLFENIPWNSPTLPEQKIRLRNRSSSGEPLAVRLSSPTPLLPQAPFSSYNYDKVHQLELSNVSLISWSDIPVVLNAMPNLHYLNVQKNPRLFRHFLPSKNYIHSNLQTLIISNTDANFSIVQSLLPCFPNLTELHMAQNSLDECDTSPMLLNSDGQSLLFELPAVNESKVTTLYLARNNFKSLLDCTPIGEYMFPKLEYLSLCECPQLSDFDESLPRAQILTTFQNAFPNLAQLSILDCPIKRWDTLELLGTLPSLKSLNIDNLPICETAQFDPSYTPAEIAKRKRFLIIAHLPNIEICNKTPVTPEERHDAERFTIRYFHQAHKNLQHCAWLYRKLVERHGELCPLAEVEMRPENIVDIKIEYISDDRVVNTSDYRLDTRKTFETVQRQLFKKWAIDDNQTVMPSKWFISKTWDANCLTEISRWRTKATREKRMFQFTIWEEGDTLRCIS